MGKKNKSNSHVGIANIIAVIGIVLLAALLFLGYLYGGDNMGISCLKSIAWALGFSFLLWFLIKAKSASTDFKKWLVVEIIVLVVYLGLAFLASFAGTKFVNIYARSGDIQQAATDDIRDIHEQIKEFQAEAGSALGVTVQGMTNATDARQGDKLKRFLSTIHIETLTPIAINKFKDNWDEVITNINLDGRDYARTWDEQLDVSSELIDGWSVLDTPHALETLKTVGTEVSQTIQSISEQLPLPTIERLSDGSYDVTSNYDEGNYSFSSRVDRELADIKPYAPLGIGVYVFVHLLILLNYFVAFRSDKARTKRHSSNTNASGGILLK